MVLTCETKDTVRVWYVRWAHTISSKHNNGNSPSTPVQHTEWLQDMAASIGLCMAMLTGATLLVATYAMDEHSCPEQDSGAVSTRQAETKSHITVSIPNNSVFNTCLTKPNSLSLPTHLYQQKSKCNRCTHLRLCGASTQP